MRVIKEWVVVAALCVFGNAALADVSDFPRPAELEPDIAFWKRVFTDVSDDHGLLHDNRNLAIVYEVLPMPASTPRRERNRRVSARRGHYQAILRELGAGKRSGLSDDEQRVLELWGSDTDNETFAAAAQRIRFQHGLADRFADSLRRAGRWRSHINEVFERHGVPVELAALPHVESSYNPAARSHVGASGIWQFTRSTGRRFMQVDHVVDARNDPFIASDSAARLLAYNYSLTGNWPMAVTAYNHGLAGARRAMRQHGDTAYVDILRNYRGRTFGFASRNFYVAFLAAMDVDQDPERYFPGVEPLPPIDYATFALEDYVPAGDVARALGISEADLGRYNPALQATVMTGNKHVPRDFQLRVPRDRLSSPVTELLAAIDPAVRHASQLPDMYHTIVRGDTLSEIADYYGTSVSTLVALNSLGSRNRIRAGQRLRLPAAGPATAVAAAAPPADPPTIEAPVEAEAADEGIDIAEVAQLPAVASVDESAADESVDDDAALGDDLIDNAMGALQAALLSDPSDYSVADDQTIEVHPLETLGHFADWLGIRTQRLRDINGLAFRTPVTVGQRIKLDLRQSSVAEFESKRAAYHKSQQDAFFRQHTISSVADHVVSRGESLWVLSLRDYDVPIWLFRQYNPEVDLHRVRVGTRVRFPVLSDVG